MHTAALFIVLGSGLWNGLWNGLISAFVVVGSTLYRTKVQRGLVDPCKKKRRTKNPQVLSAQVTALEWIAHACSGGELRRLRRQGRRHI